MPVYGNNDGKRGNIVMRFKIENTLFNLGINKKICENTLKTNINENDE